jgi:multidrug efflux pump subunit AcrA (membrane-fusion protein)
MSAKPATRNVHLSVMFRIGVCAVLLVAAVSMFILLESMRPTPEASDTLAAIPRVQVFDAAPVEVRREWEGFGTALAMDSANIPARVTATVVEKSTDMRVGRTVKRGEIITRLDESDFARQVEIAEQSILDIEAQLARLSVEERSWTRRVELTASDVKLAAAEYERIRGAFEREAAKEREVDQASRALNAAVQLEVAAKEELDKIPSRRSALLANQASQEASRRMAVQNLDRCRIVSPLDGVLQDVDIEIGENVMAGARIARVVNLERIEVPLLLPASARQFLAVGDAVRLFDGGDRAHARDAIVSRIAPEDDSGTRTLRVFAELKQNPATDDVLSPGQFVQGRVMSRQSITRWVVPRRSLNSERLKVIDQGKVNSVPIQVDFYLEQSFPQFGLPDGQWVALAEPLPVGTQVVVEGSRTLAVGSPAMAVAAKQGGTAAAPMDSPPQAKSDLERSP